MEQKKQDEEAKMQKSYVSSGKSYKNIYPQNMIDRMIRIKEQEETASR